MSSFFKKAALPEAFWKKAAPKTLYSFHETSTDEFLQRAICPCDQAACLHVDRIPVGVGQDNQPHCDHAQIFDGN
ncbi:hypothetical protein [Komagataeibacter diospyri]|uniref:hypothetical protein n=1 Tax=Komagataeibacter diospyri TaxID=1932662 RepID=UPI003758337B